MLLLINAKTYFIINILWSEILHNDKLFMDRDGISRHICFRRVWLAPPRVGKNIPLVLFHDCEGMCFTFMFY